MKPAMRKPTVLSDKYNAQFHCNPNIGTVTFIHSDWPNRWWTHIVHMCEVCCQGRIVHFCGDPDENSGSAFWGGKQKSVLFVNSLLVYLIFSCVNWSHCHTLQCTCCRWQAAVAPMLWTCGKHSVSTPHATHCLPLVWVFNARMTGKALLSFYSTGIDELLQPVGWVEAPRARKNRSFSLLWQEALELTIVWKG